MRLLFLLALLASSAAAQTPDSSATSWPAERQLTSAERALMAASGTLVAVNVFFQAGEDVPLPVRGAMTTLASGIVVYGTGRLLGNRGRFGSTMAGAGVGAVPAFVLLGLAELLPERSDDAAGMRLGAFVAYALVVPVTALIGFDWSTADLEPVVLVNSDGARAHGLALRVAL